MASNVSRMVRAAKKKSALKNKYKALRRHLNEQAVGFPATLSGVELRILQDFFTVPEVDVALLMSFRPERFGSLAEKARAKGISEETLRERLSALERKGSVYLRHRDGEAEYCLVPFIVGMLEGRGSAVGSRLFLDAAQYISEGYGYEYLTCDIPQMRVIPVGRSVDARQQVATFDQIRDRVEVAGDRIAIGRCMCKSGADLLASPCKVTDRREVCVALNDYADLMVRGGHARTIGRDEALEALDQSERDGLVLMTSTTKEPEFVCACCGCCCGVISMMRTMPRPADFAASNFQAVVTPETCNGCKKCKKRCQTSAIRFEAEAKRVTGVDEGRCVGCGLCVTTCKTGSLKLRKKAAEFVPPENHDALYEQLKRNRKSPVVKAVTIVKAMAGKRV